MGFSSMSRHFRVVERLRREAGATHVTEVSRGLPARPCYLFRNKRLTNAFHFLQMDIFLNISPQNIFQFLETVRLRLSWKRFLHLGQQPFQDPRLPFQSILNIPISPCLTGYVQLWGVCFSRSSSISPCSLIVIIHASRTRRDQDRINTRRVQPALQKSHGGLWLGHAIYSVLLLTVQFLRNRQGLDNCNDQTTNHQSYIESRERVPQYRTHA